MNNQIGSNEHPPVIIDVCPVKTIPLSQTVVTANKLSPILTGDSSLEEGLWKLANEEDSLKKEKEKLNAVKQQLQQKVQTIVEARKRSINQLKTENANVKAECEKLMKILNPGNLNK